MSGSARRDGIVVLNAGSSSLKFALYEVSSDAEPSLRENGSVALGEEYDAFVAGLPEFGSRHALAVVAAGHRVVHGGQHYTAPVLIDDRVLADLEKLVPLARLHQPHALELIRRLRAAQPSLPQVACFDTAFHASNTETARRFGIPRALEEVGLRRYGFHGLSYEFISRDPRAARGRTVVAHLGNGASLCALVDGRSVATTMSLSVLDGLVMGTRAGSLDPALVLYLL
ncbi:MAG TPA: hypothetical protein VKG44_01350, partial [Candidatus Baltobacteraceae bacterium]|nr:hypothetical protein [Candidatus Baltobacteraceae bacterium]